MNKKEGVLLMNMFIKEELDNKKYLFKDVETGTLFKIDNELYLKVSDTHAYNVKQYYLESFAETALIDNIVTEIDLIIKKID